METVLLNNELNLTYPDGFHEMGKEELSRQTFYDTAPDWSISDPDRHMVIAISWKRTNGLLAKLLNTKDMAVKMEAKIKVPMQQYGYRLEGFVAREPGGRRGDGYRYVYEVQDTGMSGESIYLKNGNTFYYIHSYYRTSLKEDSLAVLDGIFDSFSWK